MLRVAIPIILALASTMVFRTMVLPLIVSVLAGVILTIMQSSRRKSHNAGQTRKEKRERNKVVDGSYRIVDDESQK